MVDFEFEIPKDIQAMIAMCKIGCTIEGKIEPHAGGAKSEFSVEGGAQANTLAIILLTAQVCLGIAAQADDDPMKTWYVITQSVKQVILDNTEEAKEHGVRGQTK